MANAKLLGKRLNRYTISFNRNKYYTFGCLIVLFDNIYWKINCNVIQTDFLGLTVEKWAEMCVDGVVKDSEEVFRLAYYGGITHELRKELWPYLLGHYKFGTTQEQRNLLSEETKQA